jgi:hypothetical protein
MLKDSYVLAFIAILETVKKENQNPLYPYIVSVAEALREQLMQTFTRFVDEQIKAIDETKVTVKKRSGILPFIRVFPVSHARTRSYNDD